MKIRREGCTFLKPLSPPSDTCRATRQFVAFSSLYAVQIVYRGKKWLRTHDTGEYKGTRLSPIGVGGFDYPRLSITTGLPALLSRSVIFACIHFFRRVGHYRARHSALFSGISQLSLLIKSACQINKSILTRVFWRRLIDYIFLPISSQIR